MTVSPRRQPPTVRLRRLATELRRLRSAAGLTREQVSGQTAINSATLYRIETAKVRPQRRTLMTLLDNYGVTDEERRTELIALSQQSRELGWMHAFGDAISEQYMTYIGFEVEAYSVRNFENTFVPGLLQTEDYARASIAGVLPMLRTDDVERRVEVRLQRQSALTRGKPLELWAIVDEAALHRLVGGSTVMTEQLKHLTRAARQPHIAVQVLPRAVGAHPGMAGSLSIMTFEEPTSDPDIVYLDGMAGDFFIEDEVEVRRYSDIFERLRAAALNPADSIRMLRELAERV
jgi:transcriptional regulator with XRE-family HTH domain